MKTLADLFELVVIETKLNAGKQMTIEFTIDTRYNWFSMVKNPNLKGHEPEVIIKNMSIDSPAKVQRAFWMAYCEGRSYSVNEVHV